ncbi:GlsB/YeaQ/YmgE family stress response membrane protein [Noviherbaspirillum galbum]|uniref:GlsB/YeaQ/YmgE family stress response membrane protein n=1 Tax=Noviherbaspirillum galbum TaxID=2709383 RepID=UPI001969B9A8|nr:GlsB/YeaQ/YmgE family stress response membrane protein [Noviherbaspirillum galbum]
MDLLWLLLVGLIAGWLASMIVGGPFGLLGDIIVGIIGSYIGGWLFGRMGWSAGGGTLGTIIVATVGAIVLLLLIRLFNSARWRR